MGGAVSSTQRRSALHPRVRDEQQGSGESSRPGWEGLARRRFHVKHGRRGSHRVDRAGVFHVKRKSVGEWGAGQAASVRMSVSACRPTHTPPSVQVVRRTCRLAGAPFDPCSARRRCRPACAPSTYARRACRPTPGARCEWGPACVRLGVRAVPRVRAVRRTRCPPCVPRPDVHAPLDVRPPGVRAAPACAMFDVRAARCAGRPGDACRRVQTPSGVRAVRRACGPTQVPLDVRVAGWAGRLTCACRRVHAPHVGCSVCAAFGVRPACLPSDVCVAGWAGRPTCWLPGAGSPPCTRRRGCGTPGVREVRRACRLVCGLFGLRAVARRAGRRRVTLTEAFRCPSAADRLRSPVGCGG